jgi:hypothetical protein
MLKQIERSIANSRLMPITNLLWLLTIAASMHFYVFKWDKAVIIFPLLVANALLILTQGRLIISVIALSCHFLFVAWHFPRIDNHANLELLYMLNLVTGYFIFRKKSIDGFLVYIRSSSIVFAFCIYFYAGFHKLNHDFFNPTVSCVNFVNSIFSHVFTIDDAFVFSITKASQWATLFTELVLPFGLLFYRTRLAAAIGIAIFHVYIALAGLSNFGSFGILLLTVSVVSPQKLAQLSSAVRKYAIISFVAMFTLYALQKFNIHINKRLFAEGLIFNIGLFLLMYEMYKNNTSFSKISLDIKRVSFFIFILLTAWTMRAYLGFGNTGNLTMFSNLITEKNRSNHLLINTRFTKLTDWEEDQVYVIEIDSVLQKQNAVLRIKGMYIPRNELAYRISTAKPNKSGNNWAEIIDHRDTIQINDLMQSPYANSKWWYKYVSFRVIQPNGPNRCRW